jgi:hypothetical protein
MYGKRFYVRKKVPFTDRVYKKHSAELGYLYGIRFLVPKRFLIRKKISARKMVPCTDRVHTYIPILKHNVGMIQSCNSEKHCQNRFYWKWTFLKKLCWSMLIKFQIKGGYSFNHYMCVVSEPFISLVK